MGKLWSTHSGEWWARDKGDRTLVDEMLAVVKQIETSSTERRINNLVYCRLFSGRNLPSIYGMAMSPEAGVTAIDLANFNTPSFNLVGSCVETLMSKVGRNEPWILFLTDGGNFKSRFSGKRLSDYVSGLFYETETYPEARLAFQDALVFGTGIVKVTSEGKRFCVERVLPDEILVDPGESIYGKPRGLYQRRFVHRSRLRALYGGRSPEVDAAIDQATGAEPGLMATMALTRSDMIPLVEAWRLPDDEDHAGRHIVAIQGVALVDEKWDRDRFPFAVLRYNTLQSGWWGQGVGEILLPIQAKVDKTDAVITEAQSRVGRPWMTAPKTADGKAGLSVAKLTARGIANVLEHMPGAEPKVLTFPSVASDIYAEREKWIEYGFQRVGISQISAAGMRQPGLNSGEALRAQHDFESERFVTLAKDYERFFVEIARLLVEEAKAIRPKVKVPGRGYVEVMDWSDVETDFTKARFVPRAFPLSSLPTSPAGRLARADEMLQRGQITKEEHARILGYPDTEATTDLVTAPRDLIDKILDRIVEDGEDGYMPPEPIMDIDTCVRVTALRYSQEKLLETPEDRLELIQRFLTEAKALQARIAAREKQAQPQQPPAPQQADTSGAAELAGGGNPQVPSEAPVAPVLDAVPATA